MKAEPAPTFSTAGEAKQWHRDRHILGWFKKDSKQQIDNIYWLLVVSSLHLASVPLARVVLLMPASVNNDLRGNSLISDILVFNKNLMLHLQKCSAGFSHIFWIWGTRLFIGLFNWPRCCMCSSPYMHHILIQVCPFFFSCRNFCCLSFFSL